jgi:uncharacterized protein with von Willebrand factor type A (vWA) domain
MKVSDRAEALESTFREWLAVSQHVMIEVGLSGEMRAAQRLARTALPAFIRAALKEVGEAKVWAQRVAWAQAAHVEDAYPRIKAEAIITRLERVVQGGGE